MLSLSRSFGRLGPRVFLAALLAALTSLAPSLAGAGEGQSSPRFSPLFSREADDLRAEAQAARAEGRKLAIAFTLPDCPGCREMERTVFQDSAVAPRFARQFRPIKLDLARSAPIIDFNGQPIPATDFARRFGAFATPSFAFFDGRGEFLYRHTGTLVAADFKRLGRFVAQAEYELRPFAASATGAAGATRANARADAPRLKAEPPAATLPRRPDIQLTDAQGRPRRLADFHGQVVALAVGYSQCPDVCPTTLAELKAAVEALPAARRSRVQVLFATLDPERDSPALLKDYVAAFAPHGGRPFVALRGDGPATAAFIRELQLVAERQPSASMGYTLDHTAGVFLFDQAGVLRGLSPYGQPVSALAADLGRLASEPQSRYSQHRSTAGPTVTAAHDTHLSRGNPHHVQQ
ncbi:hypothetical protein AZSI13_06990 [Azospira sp. I13]|uniref:SCO family protein n=1 Tax=Azospira sp. I13 TaxID=1765050 RepID=UPI000D3F72ED|nr:SCO family protein [Azospira sp. I13]GBG01372.1 hypothetical protein AZSI13_06990 [Azospira sp. I13]